MKQHNNLEIIILTHRDYSDQFQMELVKNWLITVLQPYIDQQDRWVSKITVNSLSCTPPIYLS